MISWDDIPFYVGVHEGNRPSFGNGNYEKQYSWSQRVAIRQSGRHLFLLGWNPGEKEDGFDSDLEIEGDCPGGKRHFRFHTVEEAVKLRQAFARYPEFVDDFSESENALGTRPDSSHIGAVLWKNDYIDQRTRRTCFTWPYMDFWASESERVQRGDADLQRCEREWQAIVWKAGVERDSGGSRSEEHY